MYTIEITCIASDNIISTLNINCDSKESIINNLTIFEQNIKNNTNNDYADKYVYQNFKSEDDMTPLLIFTNDIYIIGFEVYFNESYYKIFKIEEISIDDIAGGVQENETKINSKK
jgi:hypothetical protein